ncbi:MAG: hypothetical protein ACTSQF_12505 [Candidatus Heimdallarchaeaceae archaeon]
MSFRNNQETKREFFKQLFKGVGGVAILLILLGFWLGWEGFYVWFYNSLVHIPIEERVGDPLLIGWLMILFPLLACGIAMVLSGGIKAYKLAVPPKEKDD